jgi:perosamine synthetase
LTVDDRAVGHDAPGILPFALPDITDTEIEAVIDTLRSGWLTTGPRTKEFERQFATYLGAGYAVAVNSGTAALHLALEAVGIGPGDEVIVPTYTFTASAEIVRYLGAVPVLADIRSDDLNIDADRVACALTTKTRAIIGVDIGGQPCDWDRLRSIANNNGLFLVDDAAHALPSFLQSRPIGRWADLTAFSFYATKTLTTGEGGMLVTDNSSWADRAEVMSLHGINRGAWNRYSANGSWYYEVLAPGYKYNLTDIAAAIGLVQLRRLEEMTKQRERIASAYTSAFDGLPELEVPCIREDRVSSWHLYILRLNLERLRCDRSDFIRCLASEGVSASVHFIPLHLHPYYRDAFGYSPGDFPIAYQEYMRVVSLPIYSRMSNRDVDTVIAAVRRTLEINRG